MMTRLSPTSRYRNIDAEQARNGMSDVDVAKALGIDRSTYQRKKSKLTPWKDAEIAKLIEMFGKSYEELFVGEEKKDRRA